MLTAGDRKPKPWKDTSGALSVQGLSHIADSDSRELHELLVAADINADGVITRYLAREWSHLVFRF